MADTITLRLKQGDTYRFTHTLKNPDNSPVDLTGVHAVLQIRRSPRDENVLLEASTYNGWLTIDALNGVLTGHLPPALTNLLEAESAVFQLKYIWPIDDDGVADTDSIIGRVQVQPGVARAWAT